MRGREFALLFCAQTSSWVGEGLYGLALLWLVQEITGSRAMIGLIAACRTLPSLLGFFTGALADRMDGRRIMILACLGRTALLMLVPFLRWAGLLQVWHLVVVSFLVGVGGIFFLPVRQAMIPAVVPREGLVYANSLMNLSNQLAQAFGYAAGGVGPRSSVSYRRRSCAGWWRGPH